MGIERHSTYILRCDSCGLVMNRPVVHFDSKESLKDHADIAGWSMGDLHFICPVCKNRKEE